MKQVWCVYLALVSPDQVKYSSCFTRIVHGLDICNGISLTDLTIVFPASFSCQITISDKIKQLTNIIIKINLISKRTVLGI